MKKYLEDSEESEREFMESAESGWQYEHYLRETDEAAVKALAERYEHVVPPERIEAMRNLPTAFEDRAAFDKSLEQNSHYQPKPDERVLGYAKGSVEPAHVATDHLEIPKTIYHERLHQLQHPDAAIKLGSQLTEGITEDLAMDNLGTSESEPIDRCYPRARAVAHEMREQCGDGPVEKAYFEGDLGELRRCLDNRFGAPALERLRALIEDDEKLEKRLDENL